MEDYAMRRKEYVQQIRASFDHPEQGDAYPPVNTEEIPLDSSLLWFKIRLMIALIIFCVIFFCKYNSYPFLGIEVSEIIDMISDNQYYTFLQNYVKM